MTIKKKLNILFYSFLIILQSCNNIEENDTNIFNSENINKVENFYNNDIDQLPLISIDTLILDNLKYEEIQSLAECNEFCFECGSFFAFPYMEEVYFKVNGLIIQLPFVKEQNDYTLYRNSKYELYLIDKAYCLFYNNEKITDTLEINKIVEKMEAEAEGDELVSFYYGFVYQKEIRLYDIDKNKRTILYLDCQ